MSSKNRVVLGSSSTSSTPTPSSHKLSSKRRDSVDILRKNGRVNNSRASSSSSSRRYSEEDTYDEDFEEEEKVNNSHEYASTAPKPVNGILSTSKGTSRKWNRGKRGVTFNKNATLHYLPAHELLEARRSRKGSWEAAPEHDELWDGDLQDFRRVPLTTDQLNRKLNSMRQQYDGQGYMSYTYPQSSNLYDYSGGGSSGMDDLDSYMDDLSFDQYSSADKYGTSDRNQGGSSSGSSSGSFVNKKSRGACYICVGPIEWNSNQVSAFIRDHIAGGDYFCANFEQNYVDGPMLLQMEERDLRNIGIKRRADRQAILVAKHELLRGSLSQQTCNCTKSSSTRNVLDRHSRFLQNTQSFLNTL